MLIPLIPPGSPGLRIPNAVEPLVWDAPNPLPASSQLDPLPTLNLPDENSQKK